jgi:serralysin
MKGTVSISWVGCVAMIVAAVWHGPADAASHQWRFHEIFSNADGSVQFIEMQECCGFTAEVNLGGKWILAVDASHQYDFPENLTGNTANKYLLLATQAFADLPGAPTPDQIIPQNFLPLGGDTLEYWLYSAATWTYGGLPTDGTTSLDRDGSTDVNSPTNYAGETGSIDASVPVDGTTWGAIKALWSVPQVP